MTKPWIIQPKGTDIKLLIPFGYEKAPRKEDAEEHYGYGNEIAIVKGTSRSIDFVIIDTIEVNEAIIGYEKKELIDGIHDCLADNQGLIEVEKGKTKRGYDYIYSIVKTIRENFQGAVYFLKMNIVQNNTIVDIQGTFEEHRMTGERDSFCVSLAQNAGLVTIDEKGINGWNEDPYDPSFNKGIPMNLSERYGLDALFPDHPLSQAREFITAVLEDKFVLVEKSDASEGDKKEKENKKDKYENDSKQFYLDLFAKEPILWRHTIDVEVE